MSAAAEGPDSCRVTKPVLRKANRKEGRRASGEAEGGGGASSGSRMVTTSAYYRVTLDDVGLLR